MNIALVCIAKNEDNYIDEWIEYHIKLGFSKIFIYQNDWRYKGKYINNDCICLIEYDGQQKQLNSYNDFITNNYNNFDWAGFLDIDEFVVLKQDSSISEFLAKYIDYYSVGLNWSVFGSNGLQFNGDYLCVKRFTKCKKRLDKEVKCFINFNKAKDTLHFFDSPHNVSQINKTISVDKSHFINGPFSYNGRDNRDIAYVNHYYTKTKEEWDQKMARGWPEETAHILPPNHKVVLFHTKNTKTYNEYEDLTAYNFLYKEN